jgi:hypothetical protein
MEMQSAVENKVKLGDIFCSTWGYEQTNVDFFIVVKLTDKTVWLHPIGSQTVENCGWESNYVKPDPVHLKGEVIRRKLQQSKHGVFVSINSFAWAKLVDKDHKTLQTSYY